MNDTIYDAGTMAWAMQQARESLKIRRYQEKIDIDEAINTLKEIKSGEEKLISWDLVKKWMG